MTKQILSFIQNLNNREKAYFKRFSKIHTRKKNTNYLNLYEEITQDHHNDKVLLIKNFEGTTIEKYFNSELDYLLQQILKSLTLYYFESTPQRKVQKAIFFIDILIEKGYRKKALKILKHAKSIAYKFEDFTSILKLIEYEEEVLFSEGILGFTSKLNKLQNERSKITLQIQNLNRLRYLREELRELQFTAGYISDKSKYPNLFGNELLNNENLVLSLKAKEHWYYIQDFRNYITRDYMNAFLDSEKYLNFIEQHPHLFRKSKLLPLLSNYLHNCALVMNEDAFFTILDKLEHLKEDKTLDAVYINYIKFSRLFELYYRKHDVEETEKLLTIVAPMVMNSYTKMGSSQVNYIILLIIRGFMMIRKYDKAIDWLNLWNKTGVLDYTLIHAKLFSLLVHLELSWYEFLPFEMDSASKTLKKSKKYDVLAKTIFHYISKICKNPNVKVNLTREMIDMLRSIRSDPNKNHAFEYFDYVQWFENLES